MQPWCLLAWIGGAHAVTVSVHQGDLKQVGQASSDETKYVQQNSVRAEVPSIPLGNGCLASEVPYGPLCVPFSLAYNQTYTYLAASLPPWDRPNAASLGFHQDSQSVDGLEVGLHTMCHRHFIRNV